MEKAEIAEVLDDHVQTLVVIEDELALMELCDNERQKIKEVIAGLTKKVRSLS